MNFIGIDPGITGAMAVLYETGGVVVGVHLDDTPVFQVKKGKKTSTVYDTAGMAALLKAVPDNHDTFVTLEQVHAMPGEGAVGAFSFGTGYGMWLGILAALGIPYQLTTPMAWKKLMLAGAAKEKDASRLKAMQLFPPSAEHLKLKKHHGRADALLIAEWARRTYRAKE